jgi:hypothetical protein
MEDMNNAVNVLKKLLQSEEGKKTLSSLIKNISEGDNSYDQHESNMPVTSQNDYNFDSLRNYSDIFSSIQSGSNAPRMQLLNALKPYLSSRRQRRFNTILNFMKYSDVPSALLARLNKR